MPVSSLNVVLLRIQFIQGTKIAFEFNNILCINIFNIYYSINFDEEV